MAARYGTRHFAQEVSPSVVADLPRLVSALDEPADPLSVCLLHLAQMTAREVKVVLGGDGGDELFGGYDRYAADRWLDAYRSVPEPVRNLVAGQLLRRLPDQFTFKSFTHKLRWVDLMARKTGGERYAESLQYFWFNEAHRLELYTPEFRAQLGGRRPDACVLELFGTDRATDAVDRMMYVDIMSRLPGQSLMILDRATMAYSLESRSPFLDPRLAEFMARVPVSLKIKGRRLRYMERRLGERYLPPEVLQRKKQGFASPLMYILENEVRTLAPRLLLQSELVRDGYLRGERMRQLVAEHLDRRRDHGNRIWLLLAAEVWYRRYISRRTTADLEMELADREPAAARWQGARGEERHHGSAERTRHEARPSTADELLLSAYDWESDRERITLGDAIQRFRDVNGYVGLPIPAKPAFIKVFRLLINGRRPPELIYRVHDASHVLTGSTFTHSEPPLVLLASEAVEQGLYFGSRGAPKLAGWILFYGGAFVECVRRIASFRQVFRGIRFGRLQSGLRLRTTHPISPTSLPFPSTSCGISRWPKPAGGWGCRKAARSRSSTGRSWCRRIWPTRSGASGWRSASPDTYCPHTGACDGHHSVRPLFRLDYLFLVSGQPQNLALVFSAPSIRSPGTGCARP